jgi:hypothetical protein
MDLLKTGRTIIIARYRRFGERIAGGAARVVSLRA